MIGQADPQSRSLGTIYTAKQTSSTAPVRFGVKVVPMGSNDDGTLLADRIGAIAISRVASA